MAKFYIMKKVLLFAFSCFVFLQARADVWECLTADQAAIVTKVVKKGNFIINYNYGMEKGTFSLIKLSQVDVLACGTNYNDPSEVHSIRIVGKVIANWVETETGCINPTNAVYPNNDIDDLLALNYSYVFSKEKKQFILVCDLYANYEWSQCKSFDAPSAKANGIKDGGYKKIAK